MGHAMAAGARVAGAGLAVLGASAVPLLGAALLVRPRVRPPRSTVSARALAVTLILDSAASAALLGIALALAVPHAAHVLIVAQAASGAPSSPTPSSSSSLDEHEHEHEHETHEARAGLFGVLLLLSLFLLWAADSLAAALPPPDLRGRGYAPLASAQDFELPEEQPRVQARPRPVIQRPESHELVEWDPDEADESSADEDADDTNRGQPLPLFTRQRRRRVGPGQPQASVRKPGRWCAFVSSLAKTRIYAIFYHVFLPFDLAHIRPSLTISTILSLCVYAAQMGAQETLLPLAPALALSISFALILATRITQLPILAPLLLTIPFLLVGWAASGKTQTLNVNVGPTIIAGMLLYTSVSNLSDSSGLFRAASLHTQPSHTPTPSRSLPLERRRTRSLHLPATARSRKPHARSRSQPHFARVAPQRERGPDPRPPLRPWLRLLLMAAAAWAPSWLMWACHLPGS